MKRYSITQLTGAILLFVGCISAAMSLFMFWILADTGFEHEGLDAESRGVFTTFIAIFTLSVVVSIASLYFGNKRFAKKN